MPQHVWVHATAVQCATALPGGVCVDLDEALDRVAAQPSSRAGGEQRIARRAGPLRGPDSEHLPRAVGEWHGAILAAFAVDTHVGAGVECDVAAGDRDDF